MSLIPPTVRHAPAAGAATVTRQELQASLDALLSPHLYRDYGPNGLQVEGRGLIAHIVTGVTASQAFIEAALAAGADALIVHHGLFWRGQDGRVTGWMKARLAALLGADLNLFAYHLPLDAHPLLGNNARLGLRLGLWTPHTAPQDQGRFGENDLGWWSQPESPLSLDELASRCDTRLDHPGRRAIAVVPGDGRPLRRIAWCTGGAQGFFEAAIAAGADAYITGEISEPQAHYARETGVAYIAAGHHATERDGVQALGDHIAQQLGLRHTFIDVPNPA